MHTILYCTLIYSPDGLVWQWWLRDAQVLGVDCNASDSDLTKAYKKLALKYHPDKSDQQVGWRWWMVMVTVTWWLIFDGGVALARVMVGLLNLRHLMITMIGVPILIPKSTKTQQQQDNSSGETFKRITEAWVETKRSPCTENWRTLSISLGLHVTSLQWCWTCWTAIWEQVRKDPISSKKVRDDLNRNVDSLISFLSHFSAPIGQ